MALFVMSYKYFIFAINHNLLFRPKLFTKPGPNISEVRRIDSWKMNFNQIGTVCKNIKIKVFRVMLFKRSLSAAHRSQDNVHYVLQRLWCPQSVQFVASQILGSTTSKSSIFILFVHVFEVFVLPTTVSKSIYMKS